MAAHIFSVTADHNGFRLPLRGDLEIALNAIVDKHFTVTLYTETADLFKVSTNHAIRGFDGTNSAYVMVGGQIGLSYELMYDPDAGLWKFTDAGIVRYIGRKMVNKLPWETTVVVPPVILPPTVPTITLSTSANNITINSNVTLTASVVDVNTITSIEFFKGSTLIVADLSSPYTVNVPVTSADNGTLVFKAILHDNAGNTITSTTKSVVVNIVDTVPVDPDTQPPAVVVAASQTSAMVEQSITLTATASDDKGVAKVEFYKNNVKVATVTAAPFVYTPYLTSADNGTVAFKTIAYDTGTLSTTSNTVNVVVNITPPAAVTVLTMSDPLIAAFNAARDAAPLGSKRVAAAQALVSALQPSHILNLYRNNVLISAVTYTGDCSVIDDGTNVTLDLGLINTSVTQTSADITTGAWTFTVAGGPSGSYKIQGTVGPVGSNANLIVSEAPTTAQPFDADVSFTIPRSIDGLV